MLSRILVLGVSSALVVASNVTLGPSAWTAAGIFPTTLFSSYYNNPTQTFSQVQPVITDSILVSHRSVWAYPGLTRRTSRIR